MHFFYACHILQVLSKDNPPRKTYVYRVDIPVSASWISLAVAPFEVLPDLQNPLLSHISLPANVSKLHNTLGFFYTAFRFISMDFTLLNDVNLQPSI